MIKKYLLSLIIVGFQFTLNAQEVEMADQMRGNGKIYVVVAVLVTILAGLVGYIFYLDRKVSKIENRIEE